MDLNTYLSKNDLAVALFAEKIDVKRQTIYSYLRRKKTPSQDVMKRIYEVTNGDVTANDFYDLPNLRKGKK